MSLGDHSLSPSPDAIFRIVLAICIASAVLVALIEVPA